VRSNYSRAPIQNANPQIVSQLSHSLSVPISAKIRLCSPSTLTSELGTRIAANGASWITLHARHVNARRRRAGSADLGAVKALKDTLGGSHAGVRVVSNGNVGTWDHIVRNREETGADGMMVGESILGNPWFVFFASLLSLVSIALCSDIPLTDLLLKSIFENKTPDPVLISLEYLDLCRRYPETVMIANIRTHVRHFVEYQW
jgi:tRNA-dihydrouridine synthase 1